MSTNKSNRNRNRGRGGHNNTDADGGRPHNNEDLIATVCAATSWPREDVEKALAENEWNPDLTVDAILAGVYGQRREDWVAVNKKKKQPGAVSERPRGGSGATRGGRGHSNNERGEPREGKEPRGQKGGNKSQRNPTPKTGGAGHTTAAPTTTAAVTAPPASAPATEAVKEVAKPVSAPSAAPTTNKWASGAPSFEKKEPAAAAPAPAPAPSPSPAAQAAPQAIHSHNSPAQPAVSKPVTEAAPVSTPPAAQPAVKVVDPPVAKDTSEAKPQPQPVARPVHEEEAPRPAAKEREPAVELPGSVMAEADPKLRFSVSRPQRDESRTDAKTGPSILNEILPSSAEYPADYQGMMMGGPVPPEMGGYIFPYPVFGAPHFDERQQAFGQAAAEGNQGEKSGKEGEQMPLPHQPYMPYPYPTMYPPYYPPYGMGQFGAQPQYFHHSMYKQAFSFPPGAVNPGSFEDGSPSMQFYPGFPLSFVPNGQAGGQPNEAHFDGPDYTFAPHPAIPPMMMQPAPKVPYAGPFGGQNQQRNNNRQ